MIRSTKRRALTARRGRRQRRSERRLLPLLFLLLRLLLSQHLSQRSPPPRRRRNHRDRQAVRIRGRAELLAQALRLDGGKVLEAAADVPLVAVGVGVGAAGGDNGGLLACWDAAFASDRDGPLLVGGAADAVEGDSLRQVAKPV